MANYDEALDGAISEEHVWLVCPQAVSFEVCQAFTIGSYQGDVRYHGHQNRLHEANALHVFRDGRKGKSAAEFKSVP